MLLLLAAQPLLSMHARIYQLLLLGLGYHLIIYCCGRYDYINVDYIRRRMEGLGYPAPALCSIRVTLGPKFRVLVS